MIHPVIRKATAARLHRAESARRWAAAQARRSGGTVAESEHFLQARDLLAKCHKQGQLHELSLVNLIAGLIAKTAELPKVPAEAPIASKKTAPRRRSRKLPQFAEGAA